MKSPIVNEIQVKSVLSKSNLPICEYSVNPYVGCTHACNLIWLENLNLRGNYKAVIMDYIREKHAHLLPLYHEIYTKNSRNYWHRLDEELQAFAIKLGLDYVTNDDSMKRPFDAPPIVVNYFYHSEIKKSARKENKANA